MPQDTPAPPSFSQGSSADPKDSGHLLSTVLDAYGAPVEPFTLQGTYDPHGNYIPGYYDHSGAYILGYGYYDESGTWVVTYGYYNKTGDWTKTAQPVQSVEALGWQGPGDRDYYTDIFLNRQQPGGNTLEIAMIWADQVLAITSYPRPQSVTLGPVATKGVDVVLEHPTTGTHPYELVSHDASGYALNITPHMSGLIQVGALRFSLADAITQGIAAPKDHDQWTIPLTPATSARLDMGDISFLLHFTDQPVLIAAGASGVDTTPMPYLVTSAIAHVLFLMLTLTMPQGAGALELDAFGAEDSFIQAMVLPTHEEEEAPDWLGRDEQKDAASSAAHGGDEGEAGERDGDHTNKELAIKGPADRDTVELRREQDIRIAQDSGALAMLGAQVSSPFGTTDESVGNQAIHAIGSLQGEGVGEARGAGGLGITGAGRGGPGDGDQSFGMEGVGRSCATVNRKIVCTKGRGSMGNGQGKKGQWREDADLERDTTAPGEINPGPPAVAGNLDPEIIKRVVRQHRSELRYCYEKQLQKDRALAGTVTVNFIISPTGGIMSARISSTTLDDATAETCMTSKVRRWVFPEPRGGGIVNVSYPFKFHTGS